jgi:site-specific DNA recombinase
MIKYFLYARKSTDVEDKQILSIEAQLAELRELAKRENLHITEEFIEKRSAKIPGRPIFNEMMQKIQAGEAQGIVCWKIDRLSRNPVDSGKIQWFLQQGIIQHIQTHSQSHYPNDNVLTMSVELGMANEYIRQLSENTARGLKHKAREGYFPGLAPLGYINNPHTKKISVHHKNAKIIKKLFEIYATGNSTIEKLTEVLEKNGIKTKTNHRVNISRITFILGNPIYYGHFRYNKEIYEGKHEPIITKELFDRVNSILRRRGRQPERKTDARPFCELLSCGSCNMSITGEKKRKLLANGTIKHYVYYHCTKKSKTQKCFELGVREEELDGQLSSLLTEYTMPIEWGTKLFEMLNVEENKTKNSALKVTEDLRKELEEISSNLTRLTDVYVAQDIERDDYLGRRRSLMSNKKSIEEKIGQLSRTPTMWIEPTREWIKESQTLDEISKTADLPSKKLSLQKIFGSNLILKGREASGNPFSHYAELRSARVNFSENDVSLIAVPGGRIALPTYPSSGESSTTELPRQF